MFVFGTTFFGKIQSVPGLFYVATKCFHIFFLPLIPLGTYFVFEGSARHDSKGGKDRISTLVKPMPFDIKTVLMAWLRVALILAIVGAGTRMVAFGFSIATIIVLVLAAASLHLSYVLSRADVEKAMELGQIGRFPNAIVARSAQSFLPPFGLSIGSEKYRICPQCGAINDSFVPRVRASKIGCSACQTELKRERRFNRDLASLVVLIACGALIALWWIRRSH
ncbi:MAG TPA: hypothetical protein VFP74_14240 [Pseudolabrys sp.]|jgi:hypothetical protein|nr:hypothetical protein [Pseudolabrys sp.]